jgi:hypothetical protein
MNSVVPAQMQQNLPFQGIEHTLVHLLQQIGVLSNVEAKVHRELT